MNRAGAEHPKPRPGNGGEESVVVYTDGGCVPNPGRGGWGAVLIYKGAYKEMSGGEPTTTNNRMELIAAVKALEALRRPCRVRIFTDSQYLQKGISLWLPAWKRNGWKRKGSELKNVDLWKQLDALTQKHRVEWKWVRGHAGDPLNERCDALVREAIARGAAAPC